jgi:hypothetical protein
MNCSCNMFQNTGTCYHTGYKPVFKPTLTERITKAIKNYYKKSEIEQKENEARNQRAVMRARKELGEII